MSAATRRSPTAISEVAGLIRAQLVARRDDCVGLAQLVTALQISGADLRRVIAREPSLGLAGPRDRPVVWYLPPTVMTAGFEPVHGRGRMTLRLGPSGGQPWPLMISGTHLGNASEGDLEPGELAELGCGFGELGHAIARLSLMASRWLTLPEPPRSATDRTLRLFELIARAWRAGGAPVSSSGRLHVHRADLRLPIGTRFWDQDAESRELELVVWADELDGFTLVNVYPAGTYGSIFGDEQDR